MKFNKTREEYEKQLNESLGKKITDALDISKNTDFKTILDMLDKVCFMYFVENETLTKGAGDGAFTMDVTHLLLPMPTKLKEGYTLKYVDFTFDAKNKSFISIDIV